MNNLRDAINLAKRVLTKEKLDRQLTVQSSTPFMKATSNGDSHSPQGHQKKGVTFDAMETLERNSDCIDRLTLLVSDLKMTMDRNSPNISQRYTRVGDKTKRWVDKILHLEIGLLVEEGVKVVTQEITTIGTITGQIIEIDLEADGITIGQVIGVVIIQITIDKVIRDQTTDKTPNGLLGIEVKVGIEMRIMTLEVEVETEIIKEERNPGLNLTPG